MNSNKRRILAWTVVVAVVLLVGVPLLLNGFGPDDSGGIQPLFKVRRGPLIISVTDTQFSTYDRFTSRMFLVVRNRWAVIWSAT